MARDAALDPASTTVGAGAGGTAREPTRLALASSIDERGEAGSSVAGAEIVRGLEQQLAGVDGLQLEALPSGLGPGQEREILRRTGASHLLTVESTEPDRDPVDGEPGALEVQVALFADAHGAAHRANGADSADLAPTWTESFRGTRDDLQALLARISGTVADRLQLSAPRDRWAAAHAARPAAYLAYLRGLATADEASTVQRFERAATAFGEACRLDPEFADAWAQRSIYTAMAVAHALYDDRETAMEESRAAYRRARELKPEAPLVRLAEGYLEYYFERDFERAHTIFAEALDERPHDLDVHKAMGAIQRRRGRFDDTVRHWQTVLAARPQEQSVLYDIAATFDAMRHHDHAADLFDQLLARDPHQSSLYVHRAWVELRRSGSVQGAREFLSHLPEEPPLIPELWRMARDYTAYRAALTAIEPGERGPDLAMWSILAGFAERQLGREEVARGHFAAALEIAEELFLSSDRQADRAPPLRGLALAYLGRSEEAIRVARSLPTMTSQGDHWTGPRVGEAHAEILTAAGATDLAVRQLERVLETPYIGALSVWQLRLDPIWDPLRGDPGFEALISTP